MNPKSKCPRLHSGYLAISAFVVAMEIAHVISPPLLLVAKKYRQTIWPSESNNSGRPQCRIFNAFLDLF